MRWVSCPEWARGRKSVKSAYLAGVRRLGGMVARYESGEYKDNHLRVFRIKKYTNLDLIAQSLKSSDGLLNWMLTTENSLLEAVCRVG